MLKGQPGFHYSPARSPAWCDRVLVKSALPHKSATISSYYTAADITTSDHKPVAAELVLPVVTDTVTCRRPTARVPVKLFINSVKLAGAQSWQNLEELISSTGSSAAASGAKLSSVNSQKRQQKSLARQRKLQIVLSGACLAGAALKHVSLLEIQSGLLPALRIDSLIDCLPTCGMSLFKAHSACRSRISCLHHVSPSSAAMLLQVVKVDGDVVVRGIAAAAGDSQVSRTTQQQATNCSMDASLLPREVSLSFLPGTVQDLQDDW